MSLTLPVEAPAKLEMVDVRGRLVGARDVGALGPGRHTVELSAHAGLAAGTYFVQLRQGANARAIRVVVMP